MKNEAPTKEPAPGSRAGNERWALSVSKFKVQGYRKKAVPSAVVDGSYPLRPPATAGILWPAEPPAFCGFGIRGARSVVEGRTTIRLPPFLLERRYIMWLVKQLLKPRCSIRSPSMAV